MPSTDGRLAAGAPASAAERLALVVCTHTRERLPLLVDLIDSVAAGARRPDEIFVVVDRNPSLFAELAARSWRIPVTVLESDGAGLAAARNAGWRRATAPLVAFIDDDGLASPTWLADLVRAMAEHDADVVGGRIDPRWTDGEPDWYTPLLGWVVGCTYEGMPVVPTQVRNVIGCNMLFRRTLLEHLNGFDATLGRSGSGLAGCEETELCIRASEAHARVFLIPGAPVEQVLPSHRATLSYAVRRGWHEGRSKRMLTKLHSSVLGTETRYAVLLVRSAIARLASGVLHPRSGELTRAVALLAVLASTTGAYLLYGLPQALPSVPAASPSEG